jgi:hypothetical protein
VPGSARDHYDRLPHLGSCDTGQQARRWVSRGPDASRGARVAVAQCRLEANTRRPPGFHTGAGVANGPRSLQYRLIADPRISVRRSASSGSARELT